VSENYNRWFEELGIADVPLVGGKKASLGEMYLCNLDDSILSTRARRRTRPASHG